MAGLSFNPAFHSAVLNTLREGVIHLALPQPKVVHRQDFHAWALEGLLGVPPHCGDFIRFKAAVDLIQFATKDLAESDRPQAFVHIWDPVITKRVAKALTTGVLHYLEEVTEEACQVLSEHSFLLSLRVWNEPGDRTNWQILYDCLEEKAIVSAKQREHCELTFQIIDEGEGDRKQSLLKKRRVLENHLFLSFRKKCGTLSGDWRMGFLGKLSSGRKTDSALRRLQCLPEGRFLRGMEMQHTYGAGEWKKIVDCFPSLFLRRLSDWHVTSGIYRFIEDLPLSQVTTLDLSKADPLISFDIPNLLQALPQSQVSSLYLPRIRLTKALAQAFAQIFPRSQIKTLDWSQAHHFDVTEMETAKKILLEAAEPRGICVIFPDKGKS